MDKKTKVLFVIHTLQVGGAERILVNIANSLSVDERYDITVMTIVDMGALKEELAKNVHYDSVFKFKVLKKISGGDKKYSANISSSKRRNPIKKLLIKSYEYYWRHVNVRKMYKKHIEEKYDVEVAFLEGIPSKFVSHSWNKASRKIAWIHVDLIKEPKSDRFFRGIKEQKEVYSSFDDIVCVSETVKTQIIKKYNLAEHRNIKVLYNPIDSNEIIRKSKEPEKTVKKKFTFCTVGRLSRQKGYDRLIKVVKRMNDDGLDFDVWIIGVGSEENKLRKMLSDYGINNVYLLGYKKNPYPYIKESDVFVCSSRAEGFSTVVSEAIILQKPIVATDCSGMKELLGNSEYGIVCNNTEDDLYKAMTKMRLDLSIFNKYRDAVGKRARAFSYEQSLSDIKELMESKNEAAR